MSLAIRKNFNLNAVGIWKLNNPTLKIQNKDESFYVEMFL